MFLLMHGQGSRAHGQRSRAHGQRSRVHGQRSRAHGHPHKHHHHRLLRGSSAPQRLLTLHSTILSSCDASQAQALLLLTHTQLLELCNHVVCDQADTVASTTIRPDPLPLLRLLYLSRLVTLLPPVEGLDLDPLWARVGPPGGPALVAADQSAWSAAAAVLTAHVCDPVVDRDHAVAWLMRARWMAQHEHAALQRTALDWSVAMQGVPSGPRLHITVDVLQRGGALHDAACETAAAVLEQSTADGEVDADVWCALFEAVCQGCCSICCCLLSASSPSTCVSLYVSTTRVLAQALHLVPKKPAQRVVSLLSHRCCLFKALPCRLDAAWLRSTALAPPAGLLDDAQLHATLQWLACADDTQHTHPGRRGKDAKQDAVPAPHGLVAMLPPSLQRCVCFDHFWSVDPPQGGRRVACPFLSTVFTSVAYPYGACTPMPPTHLHTRDEGALAWQLAQSTAHTLLIRRLRTSMHGGPAATLQALHQTLQSAHAAASASSAARPRASMLLEVLWSLEQGVSWAAGGYAAKGTPRGAADSATQQFYAANSKVCGIMIHGGGIACWLCVCISSRATTVSIFDIRIGMCMWVLVRTLHARCQFCLGM